MDIHHREPIGIPVHRVRVQSSAGDTARDGVVTRPRPRFRGRRTPCACGPRLPTARCLVETDCNVWAVRSQRLFEIVSTAPRTSEPARCRRMWSRRARSTGFDGSRSPRVLGWPLGKAWIPPSWR